MNQKEDNFDWDNDDWTEIEMDEKEPKLVQPNFQLKSKVLSSRATLSQ